MSSKFINVNLNNVRVEYDFDCEELVVTEYRTFRSGDRKVFAMLFICHGETTNEIILKYFYHTTEGEKCDLPITYIRNRYTTRMIINNVIYDFDALSKMIKMCGKKNFPTFDMEI